MMFLVLKVTVTKEPCFRPTDHGLDTAYGEEGPAQERALAL